MPSLNVPRPLTAQVANQLIRDLAQSFGPVLKESLLRAVLSVHADSDTLEVSLDPMYNGAGKVNEIEAALQQRVGPSPRIRVQLTDHRTAATKEQPARRSSYSERLSEASRDPLVQHAIELLGARVMRVDEP